MILSFYCQHDYRKKIIYLTTTAGEISEAQRLAEEVLQVYSDANIYKIASTETRNLSDSEGNGQYAMVGLYAQLYFREIDAPQKRHCLIIPAPSESLLEDNSSGGQRVKKLVGDWIAERFYSIFDIEVEFLNGALCGTSDV